MPNHIISQVGTLTCSNKLKRKAIRSLRLTNIKGAADVLNTAANEDEDDKADNDDEAGDGEEADDDDEADNEAADNEEADNEEADDKDDKKKEAKFSLKSLMLANAGSLKLGSSTVEIEFLKLLNSSCINLLSDRYKELYQKVISPSIFRQICNSCNVNKSEYQTSCPAETKEMINQIFDDLNQFQFE
ncbi:hypothetical protein BD408DRAFT_280083 [Parasitella parasitica]|nr:hypothetical protein BD408DRAFT_280083 [Parasitella parasitica]